jgi:hypothetical protein
MEAYKKITNIQEDNNNLEINDEDKNIIYDSQMKLCIKFCEKKLRAALKICENDENLVINRNILDKLSRLTEHNKINLNYIIGDIYMTLMNRDAIFDYDDIDFEINDLLLFINKVIQLKDVLANTKIEIVYKSCLMKFLSSVSNEFYLESDQLEIIDKILEENKGMNHDTLLKRNFDDFAYSVTDQLKRQPNIYEQYKLIIQNKKYIISMLKASDVNDKDSYERILELGKSLLYLYFNKSLKFYF